MVGTTIRRLGELPTIAWALIGAAIGVGLLATAQLWIVLVAGVFVGVAVSFYNVAFVTLVQRRTDVTMQGRVMSAIDAAFTVPFAALARVRRPDRRRRRASGRSTSSKAARVRRRSRSTSPRRSAARTSREPTPSTGSIRDPGPRARPFIFDAVRERSLTRRNVRRIATPRLDRRRLQRAPVRERQLPGEPADPVHLVQPARRLLSRSCRPTGTRRPGPRPARARSDTGSSPRRSRGRRPARRCPCPARPC